MSSAALNTPHKTLQKSLYLTEEEFQKLSMESQQKYIWLLKQEINRLKAEKSLTYTPLPKQRAFHTAIQKIKAILGGNRSGKTTAGGLEFLWHITGKYPDWYPEENRYSGAIKGRIVASDFTNHVSGVIVPFLDEWMDHRLVKKKMKNPLGVPIHWELKHGSQFDILTHEQKTKYFEGWKGHVVWEDEPCPRDKHVASQRGLVDYNGLTLMTLTPLDQPWIYDEIFKQANKPDNRIFAINVGTRENEYLDSTSIDKFEAGLTKDERAARLSGKFPHLSGKVYKEFDSLIHVVDEIQVRQEWVRYMCIDPHPRKATAILWLAVDQNDFFYIYDELSLKDMDIESMANAIKVQEGSFPAHQRFIDPAMDKDNELFGGMNVRKEFMRHGIFLQRANNDFPLGLSRVKKALRPEFIPMFKKKIPRLMISRWCDNTLFEFDHYQWDNFRRPKEEVGEKQKVKKVHDDFMDCLRYIMNADPHWYDIEKDDSDDEIKYTGEYTSRPTQQVVQRSSSYQKLIEREDDNG